MSREAERRLRVVYAVGTVFFTALAWFFRVNLVLGLAAMPAVIHLVTAERARRAGKALRSTPMGGVYRLVIGREICASALFALGAAYVALRMNGSPRMVWLELVIGALLVTYALLVRSVVTRAKAAGGSLTDGGETPPEN